jgi:hypothetical protein
MLKNYIVSCLIHVTYGSDLFRHHNDRGPALGHCLRLLGICRQQACRIGTSSSDFGLSRSIGGDKTYRQDRRSSGLPTRPEGLQALMIEALTRDVAANGNSA